MQLRGGFQLVVLSGKTPGRVLNFKKKTQGGFYPGEGFSNCYTGKEMQLADALSCCPARASQEIKLDM